MRRLFVVMGLLILPLFSHAGSFVVTTTTAEDAVIARDRLQWNARNLPGAPYANDTAYFTAGCRGGLLDRHQLIRSREASDGARQWQSMTRAQKDAVCAAFFPALPAGCDLY
jgi:hypothetical protein